MDNLELGRAVMRYRQEEMERILALDANDLGVSGGCHIAASILKRHFPEWEVVAFLHEMAVKHVALRQNDRIMDIRGVRPQHEFEQRYGCAPTPIDLSAFDYRETGLYYDEPFWLRAEAKLSAYIELRVDDLRKGEKGSSNRHSQRR